MGFLTYHPSGRSMTNGLNDDECINNIYGTLGAEVLDEIPHYDTINDCLERVEPGKLEELKTELLHWLMKRNWFRRLATASGRWLVLLDATGYHNFGGTRHCDDDMTKIHKRGTVDEWTEYFHNLLEAVLCVNGMVFSIASVIMKNEPGQAESGSKQTCELTAAKELLKKLKAFFNHKRYKVCIMGDALYEAKPFMELVRSYGWDFVIRHKDTRVKDLAESFSKAMEDGEATVMSAEGDDGRLDLLAYVNGVTYKGTSVNMVELVVDAENEHGGFSFAYVTSIRLTIQNASDVAYDGRGRWLVENRAFKTLKDKRKYGLEHVYSMNPVVDENNLALLQIAHALSQLIEREHEQLIYRIGLENFHDVIRLGFMSNNDGERNVGEEPQDVEGSDPEFYREKHPIIKNTVYGKDRPSFVPVAA
jgi:hypothetical protein